MKVYSKKEDKKTIVPAIIITIFFLSVSIGMFIAGITSEKSFIDILASFGIASVFAIIFFGFGMYFVTSVIMILIYLVFNFSISLLKSWIISFALSKSFENIFLCNFE